MEVARLIVLALNCGSSSLKFGLYRADAKRAAAICDGEAEEIGGAHSSFWFRRADGEKVQAQCSLRDHEAALSHALDSLRQPGMERPSAVGHRFVHGGPRLSSHRLLDAEVMKDLEGAVEYAPLHMPAALQVLRTVERKLPGLPQAICLDTAFHRTMPDVSRTYALPEAVRKLGVERYGFHGLSIESILGQLATIPERLIVAHLGNGASITAIRNARSVDTTMGLTPTGGVMMGTRCGDLDPGVAVYLLRHGYEDAERLENVFDQQSGLRGVSGLSSDVRELEEARSENAGSDLALRMFCYQVRKAIGGMAAALGGADMLVFTGGIGEHADKLRREIVDGLLFLNADALDVRVLPSQEDEQIAKNTARLVSFAAQA